jgi:hypothetical protein
MYGPTGPAFRDAEPNAVLCKTCSVLLCILEQPRIDNSSAGPNWEQLVQLTLDRLCVAYINLLI